MGKQIFHSYTPGQTAVNSKHTDAVNQNSEETRKGTHPIYIKSKSHPKEADMEKKENFAIESFWKEALKADSLLFWIVFNIGHNREERA